MNFLFYWSKRYSFEILFSLSPIRLRRFKVDVCLNLRLPMWRQNVVRATTTTTLAATLTWRSKTTAALDLSFRGFTESFQTTISTNQTGRAASTSAPTWTATSSQPFTDFRIRIRTDFLARIRRHRRNKFRLKVTWVRVMFFATKKLQVIAKIR